MCAATGTLLTTDTQRSRTAKRTGERPPVHQVTVLSHDVSVTSSSLCFLTPQFGHHAPSEVSGRGLDT